ncbi:MAG: carbohydrate ABC transporter permease [Turicibacter sp.]
MKERKKRKMSVEQRRHNILGYSFLSVWLTGFLIFTAFPLLYTIYLSFNTVTLTVKGWETGWIGIENYVVALLKNVQFTPALSAFVTMEVLYVPTIVIISFILALLLNQKIKGRSLFRTIYFLPVIVLSGSVMLQLMDSGNTEMGGLESLFIYKMIASYSEGIAMGLGQLFHNFSMILWFTGIPIVLFINALQKINRQLYEAAQIDGATAWQILWKITLPIVRPMGLIISIFAIVQLGMFPINPVYSLIQESMYNTVGGLGLASAYAWIYSLVILIFIGIAYLLFREKPEKDKKKKQKQYERQLEKLHRYQEKEVGKKIKTEKISKKVSKGV